jgi:hypothetical protein
MTAKIIHLPTASPPPPQDARPIGKPCTVHVFPWGPDEWSAVACDDGGAMLLAEGVEKWIAIEEALAFVRRWNAELMLSNRIGG